MEMHRKEQLLSGCTGVGWGIKDGVLEEPTRKLGLGEQAGLCEAEWGGSFGSLHRLNSCLPCRQSYNEVQVCDYIRGLGFEGGVGFGVKLTFF